MRRRRSPISILDLAEWREKICKVVPECRERIAWVEGRFPLCESDLERAFVMLVAVSTFKVDNLAFAGAYPPGSKGQGKRCILNLEQQVEFVGYRCDFMMTIRSVVSARSTRVAIECDGHSFHDRTIEQASSDRRRDRKLIANGVPTLRYTYADLTRDPSGFMRDFHETMRAIMKTFCDQEVE